MDEELKGFRPLTGNLYSKYDDEKIFNECRCVSVPSRGIYIPNSVTGRWKSSRNGFRPLTGNLYSKLN